MKKILDILFSTRAAGMYTLLFAISIGVATFIENDFGTSAAQKVVYQAKWFEVLLVFFAISIIVNIFRFRMVQRRKWPILTFHIAIIVILIGSALTRYLGYEGRMHIREGSSTNLILSSKPSLQFEVRDGDQVYRFDEDVHFASLGKNQFHESYQINDHVLDIRLKNFMANPVQTLVNDANGKPVLKLVVSGGGGREDYFLPQGELINMGGQYLNFGRPEIKGAINIYYRNDSLLLQLPDYFTQMTMATQTVDTVPPLIYQPLKMRSLYSNGDLNFVVAEFNPKAILQQFSSSAKMLNNSNALLQLGIDVNGNELPLEVEGSMVNTGKPVSVTSGDLIISAAYGPKYIELPFSIGLRDFIMERYPGTNSASSYASEVTLLDPRKNVEMEYRIYMNNILNYGGYRFFQSSFDQDELGTILSVNHDFFGTWVSYLGYFLLTLGMILTLVYSKSRFRSLSQKLKHMRLNNQTVAILFPGLFFLGIHQVNAASSELNLPIVDETHAVEFATSLVQDYKGRIKPMHTMASEILRKLARKETLYGQNSSQVLLGMMAFPDKWSKVPLIKIGKNPEIQRILKSEKPLLAYADFFEKEYLLREHVRTAVNKEAKERGTFEKELLKIDERVNIANMVFTGRMLKLFPVENDPNNTWQASFQHNHGADQHVNQSSFAIQFLPFYLEGISKAVEDGDWENCDKLVRELKQFQQTYGTTIIPSPAKVKMEIQLNKMKVFSRLGKLYALGGLLFLIMFFVQVFNHRINPKWPLRIALGITGLLFLYHTIGLAMRWYISGHAPWSNGYESMIYIAWTTVLAGLYFARNSLGGLAATTILSSTILMVAGLSFLDPEITPLVPVLKSYWLTIHVSLEAGSYGFLLLGAIIGILNLVLIIFANSRNRERVYRVVREMTYISEMTLIGGLIMVSVGTYLGGVWANESWGRYWGWDAKETWALVTVLTYAFILHMRFIPGLRGVFAFNLSSLFGMAVVMMTYYGVNYYLSGLHSYAAGDPVPIPSFVYYTVTILTVISLISYWNYRRTYQN